MGKTTSASVFGVLLVGAMVTGMLLVGCGETSSRHATEKLAEATRDAARLYGRAVSLMAATPVKVGGDYIPMTHAGHISGSSEVELPEPLAVHPEAWEALVRAEKALTGAIREYGSRAGRTEQALANAMLGNVLMLQAEYKRASVAADRQTARGTLAQADQAVSTVQLYAALASYYEQVASLSDADVREMLSTAQADAARATRQAEKVRQDVASLREQIRKLKQANASLVPQVRNLRLEAEKAGGQEGMELLDQALSLEAEVNENNSSLAALEQAMEKYQTTLSDLALTLQWAEGRADAAEAIIAVRQGYVETGRGQLQGIQDALAKAKTDTQEHVARVTDVLKRIADAETTAAETYRQATAKHGIARRGRTDGQMTARLADAHWAAAELSLHRLDMRHRAVLLATHLANAWSPAAAPEPLSVTATVPVTSAPADVPTFGQGLLDYVPDPQAVRSEAIENYRKAAELYETASRQVPVRLRWAYQGQAGAAYLALYRLSGEGEALDQAKQALETALEGKRESPYLATVVELERLLALSAEKAEAPREIPAETEP